MTQVDNNRHHVRKRNPKKKCLVLLSNTQWKGASKHARIIRNAEPPEPL